MKPHAPSVFVLSFWAGVAMSADFGRVPTDPLIPSKVMLNVELLLQDGSEIFNLWRPGLGLVEAQDGGMKDGIALGTDGTTSIEFFVRYELTAEGRIAIRFTRTLIEGDRQTPLPTVEAEIDVLDVWVTTVLSETGRGKLLLRLTPIVRQDAGPRDFESGKLSMYLRGGPLLQYHEDDLLVVLEQWNALSGGKKVGIPKLGHIELTPRPLPGFERCGWIRGHKLQFKLGGRMFVGFSEHEILPADPSRPDDGWNLYGRFLSDPKARAYYGSFDEDHPTPSLEPIGLRVEKSP